MEKKNYGKSVKTRLLNLTNETGYKYMYLLARYFNERLLYRVSVSQYKDNFLLKGGSLLYAMDGLDARPTTDVDFMAERINRDRDNPELKLFTDEFINDAKRQIQWKLFLKKIQWKEELDFSDVMQVITNRLKPMAEKYWNKE